MAENVAKRLEELSPEQRAKLLEKLRLKAQTTAQTANDQAVPVRSDRASYPLSFAQQRMWILSQLEPDSPFYNIALALRLSGRVNVQALEDALNEIIRRHEVLRASFVTERGNPVQVIAPELRVSLTPEEVAGQDVEAAAHAIASAEARKPFDLARGPLLRGRLLRLRDDGETGEYLALLTFHHIVTDGWSTGVLVTELATLYEAYTQKQGFSEQSAYLPSLPLQYADYAAWERARLQGERLENELAYWKEALRDIPLRLELPTDRPRPAVQTVSGAVYPFELPAGLSEKLHRLARAEGATLFQVLLAAYQVLLHRYSNQDDICVGTPIANRQRQELEGLIGFFVNTVVMRSDFSDDPSFRELLRRLKERALSAQAHQDVPFELLVDSLGAQRNMSTTPVFQVMFTLEQRSGNGLKLRDTVISPVETHSGTAKFDMTLLMIEEQAAEGSGATLRGSLEYNTDLWYGSTISRMMGHYRLLLEGIAADPEMRVGQLRILLPEEERQLLLEWNDTATDYPRDRCLHELFEEQVRLGADAPAVTYDDQTLTYGELNARANRLAHWLQELGVEPESLVGVYLERGLDMVVAVLGIVKAGGAYLPLDMEYPPERLAFMLRDGDARVLITQSHLQDRFPGVASEGHVRLIRMDADATELAARSAENPPNAAEPGNLAYVIYTSGSTGVPKGVSIPQRAIARLIFNTNYIDLQPSDKIGQASNASFDAATFEIWGALLRGAELVGVRKELALAPKVFAKFLRDAGINTLFLTTALVNHIAAEEPTAFNTLDCLMFGGEAVDTRWVRRILEYGGPRRLLHVYGPTESTTFASWHPIREVAPGAVTIPIGRPLSNTQMYVLDRHFRPVPTGVSGELCIGGDGLAVSYLNRPELTAEKFAPNPFVSGEKPGSLGERLYRTGDLVRYLPGGSIEFQGRIDHQVKVRGFRIELGEIEAVLARNPLVRQAFVMVRQDAAGDDRVSSSERKVVAYVAPAEGASPTAGDLRKDLKDHLPDYMIPAAFVFVDSLPINPNGKVDRGRLPPPDYARIEGERPYVAPRSPVERFLAQKWQEVLGIEKVSVTDNFFELGGNSLQAAVLTNRMQEELGATAHVRALFMAPTIADLANYLDEYYPDAVARITGIAPIEKAEETDRAAGYTFQEKAPAQAQIDDAKVARFRVIVPPLPDRAGPGADRADRNPPAVFVLSPPRSGSTLLRVMLAGNPRLFAPPELDLLSFNTLAERRAAFSGKYQFWLEGPIKAIMELKKCSADQAEELMAGFEAQGWTTKRFYRQLQEWIAQSADSAGPRYLVDKTPVYPMDSAILDRMEQDFADVRYLHLVRHPFATVYSFMEAKLEDIFFRWEHPWSMRELAELVYLVSHRNIVNFLQRIPADRQHRVWFEEMVGDAPRVMHGICDFLEIEFHPDMLEPYKGDKMTSGVRPGHQMVGDFKFYLRNKIDPKAADRWKRFKKGDVLADMTWDVARQFNYEIPPDDETAANGDGAEGANSHTGEQGHVAIQPRQPGEPVELSFAQERLWFLDQFERAGDGGGSPFYNVPAAVRLTGRLDTQALGAALNAIVARHEVLRTTFRSVDGVATPHVVEQMVTPLPVVDLTGLPREQREATAARMAAEEARRPFNLATGPLLRGQLLDLGAPAGAGADGRETIALITMHHIVSDGWSVNVFIKELAALYAAYASEGKPGISSEDVLSPLPIQYADFAAWQRRWFSAQGQGEASSPLQQQLAYWQEQLKGLPPILELPTDRPRPAVQTQNGERYTFTLNAELTAKLRGLARGEGATMFMTLLAAFQTLLMRYTGQEDIAVGTPIAGRNRPEIANLIGFFVNTLVLRGDLSGAPTFRQLLKRVQATAIKAYENQDVPFEMLVDTLLRHSPDSQRDMSHTPLFQAMFALQDAPLQAMKAPGLTLSPMQPDTKTAKFDLMLNVVERTDALRCALEYNTDLFDGSTAARMAEHLGILLDAIVAEPDRAITTLPLLAAAERRMLFTEWNDTEADIDTQSTLARRIEEQAERTPDALAVLAEVNGETQALTYRELDAAASEVAGRLASLGVGPESIVGLMAERSADLLAGVLGIWKAGAAYVPLDPSYPADRLAYMLADSGAKVVVTQERLATAEVVDRLPTVLLDRPDVHAPAAAPHSARPDNLAYVIYTSGSTGRPKGVAVTHRTALNLAGALKKVAYDRSELGRPLRVSLNAPLAFDASVQQLVMLTQGHAVVIIPQQARADAPALLEFIRRQRLDQLDCVPSQLKLLLAEGLLDAGSEWTPSIVFPGGEAIDEPTWAGLAAAPATHFYNMYGPTECTVDSTTISARLVPRRPTIGRPMANARAYVLDRNLQPAPVGVPGELFIAGAGVTRGYLGRPELTAERFLPDPFAAEQKPGRAGARMYRTGDRVRWLPDGTLEFLGRVDFQVKVRGFRIELGEIEETLRKHEAIAESVVLAPEGEGGARRLLAYVVPRDPAAPPTAAALRQHLLATLPEYMVPAAFLVLDAMPLTPNAKIDRKALLAIRPEGAARAESGVTYVAPSGPVETALAAIYAKVLGVPHVGAHDNFFELGGDSILTIQVVARAGQAGIRITPKQLFQAPTVAGLALLAEVAPADAAAAEQGLVEGELPLTPIQRVFFESEFAKLNHWNQSLLLSVRGRLSPSALQAATRAVLRQHDALRLRFEREAGGWRQVNAAMPDHTPFEFVDLSGLTPAARSEALRERTLATQESLDLATGPLARVVYFDYGPSEPGRLLTVVHHLAVDRVSWRILLEDLGTAYEQAGRGEAPSLPLKTTSFREWAKRLAAFAQSPALADEAAYWLRLERSRHAPLTLDSAGGSNTEADARTAAVFLEAGETESLLRDAGQAYGMDAREILLAALAVAYRRWIGAAQLLLQVEGHGRQAEILGKDGQNDAPPVDLSRTVGWFTALYPALFELRPEWGERETLLAVKEQARSTPNGGIGYGLLRYLSADPDITPRMARLPEPEISFNYLGQFVQDASGSSRFGPAPENSGPDHAAANRRQSLLDVTASVFAGRLRAEFTFSDAQFTAETIETLAEMFIESLRGLIQHCLSPEAGGYSASDFADAGLDEEGVQDLLLELGEIDD